MSGRFDQGGRLDRSRPVSFRFEDDLDGWTIVRFVASRDPRLSPDGILRGQFMLAGQIQVVPASAAQK